MWTKDECSNFFKRTFDLDLRDEELDLIWHELDQNRLTSISRHGGNTVGFSPNRIQRLIQASLKRSGGSIADPRYKKVREEILPASIFALILKKLGHGQHLLVSQDAPDIALVKWEPSSTHQQRRPMALPIEAMFIPANFPRSSDITPLEEEMANFIISHKFIMRYVKETILLISLGFVPEILSFEKLAQLIGAQSHNPYHQIWIMVETREPDYLVARIHPSFEYYTFSLQRDLIPILY